jgi:hypothetical protein
MLEEAPRRVVFLTVSITRDPAKSVTALTNLQDIDGGIAGLKRCCVDDEVLIPLFRADFPRFTCKLVEVWPNLPVACDRGELVVVSAKSGQILGRRVSTRRDE